MIVFIKASTNGWKDLKSSEAESNPHRYHHHLVTSKSEQGRHNKQGGGRKSDGKEYERHEQYGDRHERNRGTTYLKTYKHDSKSPEEHHKKRNKDTERYSFHHQGGHGNDKGHEQKKFRNADHREQQGDGGSYHLVHYKGDPPVEHQEKPHRRQYYYRPKNQSDRRHYDDFHDYYRKP